MKEGAKEQPAAVITPGEPVPSTSASSLPQGASTAADPSPPSKPQPSAKAGAPAGLGGPSLPSRQKAPKKSPAAAAMPAEGAGLGAKGPQLPPKSYPRESSSRSGRSGPNLGASQQSRPAGDATGDAAEHIEDIPVQRSRPAQPPGGLPDFASLLGGLGGSGGVGGVLSQIASDPNTMDLIGGMLGGGAISSSRCLFSGVGACVGEVYMYGLGF